MSTLSTNCPSCRRKLSISSQFANTVAPCPKCGTDVVIPPPGMGQSKFISYKLIQFIAFFVLAGLLKLPALLVMPLMIAASVFIATARLEYLGMAKSNAILAIFPFVSFVHACVLAFSQPNRGRKQQPAPQPTPIPSRPAIPSPEEVASRVPTVMSEQEKQVVKAIMNGASIETAAAQAGTTIENAKGIYGAFHKTYISLPESARQAFLDTTLDATSAGTVAHGTMQKLKDAMPITA